MKRFVMTVVVVGVMALLVTSVAQAQSNVKFFIGLWDSVSARDGSLIRILLSDSDGDRVLEFAGGATYWGDCVEEGEVAQASLTGTVTINAEGNLVAILTRTCLESNRSDLDNQEVIFEVNREADSFSGLGLIFHRISAPPEKQ